ncbi:MAG: SMP-30/gluconolactonase/LRE family protein [Acidimicrobiales bacterium]
MSQSLPHSVIATDLAFPEGPVALSDGDVLIVEVRGPRITRVSPDGSTSVVVDYGDAETAGPNGLAIGPDGALYVCNNGGFIWSLVRDSFWLPSEKGTGANQSPRYVTGSIDRVDLDTGEVTTLYDSWEGNRLTGPNDLVFDAQGGIWFTDHGKTRPLDQDRVGVYWARADGSEIRRPIFPLDHPNGIGLSPDGSTLYVAETSTGRLWAWDVTGPGEIDRKSKRNVVNSLGHFDSLGVEEDGTVVVAALPDGLCVARPDGEISYVEGPGMLTNVCWGGPDMMTAYATDSLGGQLLAYDWPRPGLRLNYNA